jgi:DNA-binding winged helix-turn-helix (wHTH) protein
MQFDLGDLTLNVDTRQLRRATEDLRLSPKAFDFLSLLVQAHPRVVTKAELHEKIWAGVFVSDASIAMVASEVRAALGESARAPQRIRTVHGHGYSFQGTVTALSHKGTAPRYWLVSDDRVWPLRHGDNIVGRDLSVELRIDNPGVSRRHARLRLSDAGLTIEDLGSKNGTFVGDSPVSAVTPIADGAQLRFGSTVVVFRVTADPTQTEVGA